MKTLTIVVLGFLFASVSGHRLKPNLQPLLLVSYTLSFSSLSLKSERDKA